MLGRRFLLLVAVLMGLTALAASVAPREPLVRDRRAATPSPTPTSEPTAPATSVRSPRRSRPRRPAPSVTVRKGDLVRLEVRGNELDSVRILDEIEPIDVNSPAIFELFADRPGEYTIELVEAERQVGTLVVR